MAENGYFERPAAPQSEFPSLLSTDQSEPESLQFCSDLPDGWVITTPEVDLGWMVRSDSICLDGEMFIDTHI